MLKRHQQGIFCTILVRSIELLLTNINTSGWTGECVLYKLTHDHKFTYFISYFGDSALRPRYRHSSDVLVSD